MKLYVENSAALLLDGADRISIAPIAIVLVTTMRFKDGDTNHRSQSICSPSLCCSPVLHLGQSAQRAKKFWRRKVYTSLAR